MRGLFRTSLATFAFFREIGRGGMGMVYEAIQESLGRRVALKVLRPEYGSNPSFLMRFRREARSAASLHHSNIVPVFGVGVCDGHHYFAMQYIPGQTLENVLDEVRRLRALNGDAIEPTQCKPARDATVLANQLLTGRFALAEGIERPVQSGSAIDLTQSIHEADGPTVLDSPASLAAQGPEPKDASEKLSMQTEGRYFRGVARVGMHVADAIAYAHNQGVLHRDIKPANLLLDARSVVWVTDFGLAKSEGTEAVTEAGDIVGTLRYMAPERFQNRSDRRSDVYSLGITLYEMATLRPPLRRATAPRSSTASFTNPPLRRAITTRASRATWKRSS